MDSTKVTTRPDQQSEKNEVQKYVFWNSFLKQFQRLKLSSNNFSGLSLLAIPKMSNGPLVSQSLSSLPNSLSLIAHFRSHIVQGPIRTVAKCSASGQGSSNGCASVAWQTPGWQVWKRIHCKSNNLTREWIFELMNCPTKQWSCRRCHKWWCRLCVSCKSGAHSPPNVPFQIAHSLTILSWWLAQTTPWAIHPHYCIRPYHWSIWMCLKITRWF